MSNDATIQYVAAVDLNCSGVHYPKGTVVDTGRLTRDQVQFLLTWKRIVPVPVDNPLETADHADA